MNYNCKYCDYVDKCSRKCEYDSILCKMNRSFPKIVKRPYKEILYENSNLKLENTNLKQALIDIREYTIKEKEFNNNQINEYKTCIETNLNGKFNKEEKENMEHCMTVNICINYKMNDILQIIDKAIGDEENDVSSKR